MKTSLLFALILFPVLGFGQVVDTVKVVREVDSLIQLNRSFIGERHYDEALRTIEMAENKVSDALGTYNSIYANCLFNHGRTFRYMRQYTQAEIMYLKSLDIREKILGKEHPDYASNLNNLAVLYWDLNQYQKAELLYIEAKDIRKRILGREHLDYAASLNNLAILYKDLGRFEEAEPLYIEAKNIREKKLGKAHPDYAASLNNLANLYKESGEYEKAEPLYFEATNIWKKALGEENLDYAEGLNNFAGLYHNKGEFEKAEFLYIKVKDIMGKHIGKRHPNYAHVLNSLAVFYYTLGQNKKAESLYFEAINILEETLGNKHSDYAGVLNNLANLLRDMGQYEKAEPIYLEAKNIREYVFGKEHPDYAASLSDLGTLHWYLKHYEKAESLYLEAKDIRAKVLGKEHPDYASSLNDLGILYPYLNQYEKAESLCLEAKDIRAKVLGKEHPDYVETLYNLTTYYREIEQYDNAKEFNLEACFIQKKLLQKSMNFMSEQEIIQYYPMYLYGYYNLLLFAKMKMANPPSLYGTIWNNTLFCKNMLLNNSKILENAITKAPDTIQNTHIRWKGYHRRLAREYAKPIAERRDVEELEEKANTLEKELTRSVAGFGEALRQVTWQEVQSNLPPRSAAIEFIHYRYYNPKPTDSTFYSALVLHPGDSTPFFIPLFEEREIAPLLHGASGNAIEKINTLYADQSSSANQKSLYDLIWKPLDTLLGGVTRVYCAPSGLLHRLNLGAIPVAEEQTFAERRSLVLLGSTRQLAIHESDAKMPEPQTAALFGGIQYDSMAVIPLEKPDTNDFLSVEPRGGNFIRGESGVTAWGYLKFSEQEVKDIQNRLLNAGYRSTLITGIEATEESVKGLGQKGPSPDILHIATHGFFYPDPKDTTTRQQWQLAEDRQPVFKLSDNPMMRSGLILAGANRVWRGGDPLPGRDDGILTAYEISQMNLSNTELVVLSACETGLGDIEGNEGVYGLQRAFKIAGAKYLIMSLWNVWDNTTQEFMGEFYRQWLEKGMSIPDAFRAAQTAMKKKYQGFPYHWAGFVLIE